MRRLRDSQPLAVKAIVPAKTANDHEKQESLFSLALVEHLRIIVELNTEESMIQEIARRMTATLRRGGKILFCGNGGSAADAQHLAAELVGRFQAERRGLAAIALTTDSSVLTSIANDYGYEEVFRRQVEALACPGDILIGLSTSGESDNVCAAITAARLMDVYTVALCGKGGSRLAELADLALIVPSDVTARIQEAHIFCGHVLCACVEAALNEEAASSEVGESLMSRKQTWAQERDVARSEGTATLSVVERRQADTATLPSTTPPSRPKPGRSGWQMRDDTHSNRADTRGEWL